jgi:hypothetical protein
VLLIIGELFVYGPYAYLNSGINQLIQRLAGFDKTDPNPELEALLKNFIKSEFNRGSGIEIRMVTGDASKRFISVAYVGFNTHRIMISQELFRELTSEERIAKAFASYDDKVGPPSDQKSKEKRKAELHQA